jgi:hypothetical protein
MAGSIRQGAHRFGDLYFGQGAMGSVLYDEGNENRSVSIIISRVRSVLLQPVHSIVFKHNNQSFEMNSLIFASGCIPTTMSALQAGNPVPLPARLTEFVDLLAIFEPNDEGHGGDLPMSPLLLIDKYEVSLPCIRPRGRRGGPRR